VSDETLAIKQERVTRMLDALACVTIDDFEQAAQHLGAAKDDAFGEIEDVFAIFVEDLRLARMETARAREAEQKLIAEQAKAIKALSTPVLDVWDGVVTLPIISSQALDQFAEMTESLLSRIVQSEAKCVVVDVTGLDVIDEAIANDLVQMITAAKLLGSYCVITGVSPDLARTLVELELDFGDVPTLRTLYEGLRVCLRYLGDNVHTGARGRSR
jgi:rsbT co-antagonist protein RsbR